MFDNCGIASIEDWPEPPPLEPWLAAGYHADMHWMAKSPEIRKNPRLKLPGAKSVVVVTRNYYAPDPSPRPPATGKVARYARGRDYHRVLRKPLLRLARAIEALAPGTSTYASIDSGPVAERTWAQRAGVAAIGKNSLALRSDSGSYFFLATILTTLELTPDEPARDVCGSCRLCLDACPTQAIVEPMVVDANRCISYQTIENRGEVPKPLQSDFHDWVFGCDVCQEVCPWNRFATPTTEHDFAPRPDRTYPELSTLQSQSQDEFDRTYAGSPIRRAKHEGMRRNAEIVARNAAADSPSID
jgi:epoxyqueuosine reductase